jgi:hypothetical protein
MVILGVELLATLLPHCPRYIAWGQTVEKTLSGNGLQRNVHCSVSSRYQVTSSAALEQNYSVHITISITGTLGRPKRWEDNIKVVPLSRQLLIFHFRDLI